MNRADSRRLLEVLELLASRVEGEVREFELAATLDLTAGQLEKFSSSRYVKTRYRGIIGAGYIAWSITDAGRELLTDPMAAVRDR